MGLFQEFKVGLALKTPPVYFINCTEETEYNHLTLCMKTSNKI